MLRVAALALLAAAAMPAVAAPGPETSAPVREALAVPPVEEIIVEAPRSLPGPEIVGRSPHTGAAIVVMTLRIPVLYDDLDLTDPADADRLMTRVERVAQDACGELDRLYPLTSDPDCVLRTVKGARPVAEARIAAARLAP